MESSLWWSKETVAVVTGANRGIGHETVRQLASKGITVILASRDEKSGRAAMEELHSKGLKTVDSHALDIGNPDSVTGFAKWLKSTYGGLDILVNNAAVGNLDAFSAELAIRDVKINYEGTKNVTETLLPLMKHSDAGARIVFLSSLHGQLVYLEDEALREQLTDPNNFTEATLDSIAEQYYAACKAGPEEAEKFTPNSYQMSKILITAYSRLLAKRLASRPEGEKVYVNCADPGVVLTDSYKPEYGPALPVDQGADTPVWLALHPKGGPSGGFFLVRKESSFVGTKFATVEV
jgi:NAD(P)-dependent dehydrogenase (short-subunit alcohol dehydrogenase family)